MSDRWHLVHLQKGDLILTLLPGIGGRLWEVTFKKQSILFQNPDLLGIDVEEAALGNLPSRSPQFGFPLWGGEKTWIAPETEWANGVPFPVLDSGAYAVTSKTDSQVEMASAICPLSHLSITRRVSLTSANSFAIEHSVTNDGRATRPTGIWSVMMLETPTLIGVAANRPAFDPVFGSAQGMVTTHPDSVVVDCRTQREFKIGLPNPDGTTLIKSGTDGFWLTCGIPVSEGREDYAHRHPVEVFNSGDYAYCEAEWHSPLRALAPGETMQFKQVFKVVPDAQAASELAQHKALVSCMS
ncbi:MAG: hypothetical protein AB3N13_00850 [Arenibacterium sp.]